MRKTTKTKLVPAIDYPSFKVPASPTPCDRLIICDKCARAEWIMQGWPAVCHCPKQGHGRMREATEKEYQAARVVLARRAVAGVK